MPEGEDHSSTSNSGKTTAVARPPRNNNNNSKRRRNRGRKSTQTQGNRGPPQAPQLKITLRNIHQHETTHDVAQHVLKALIQRANERLSKDEQINLDSVGLKDIITAEEKAKQARKDWEKQQTQQSEGETSDNTNPAINENDESADPPDATTPANDTKLAQEKMEQLQISETDKSQQDNKDDYKKIPGIATRVLFIVPAKKTRRRGEKPGCAYLVLTTPVIEPKSVPSVIIPDTVEEGKETEMAGNTAVVPQQQQPLLSADYSKEIAQRRLMLKHALEALSKCAAEDSPDATLAGVQVEESINAKTWRTAANRRDRFEGTIWESPDYKEFFVKTAQLQQERQSRPRPAPGGGSSTTLLANTTGSSLTAVGKQQPVAALVLHLQKRKEEESKKRKQKKQQQGKKNRNNNATRKDQPQQQLEADAKRKKKKKPKRKKKAGGE